MGALVRNGKFYIAGSNKASNIMVESTNQSAKDTLTAQDGTVFNFVTDGNGNYGFVNADGIFVPIGRSRDTSRDPILLWTNPNLSATFDVQTLVFNQSIPNGTKYLMVETEAENNVKPYLRTVIDIETESSMKVNYAKSSSVGYWRTYTYTAGSDSIYAGGGNTNIYMLKPVNVYAI